MYEPIQNLVDELLVSRSFSELYQSTAELVKENMDADFGVIATEQHGAVQALATMPEDWTDTDDLLSPVSLPHIASSQGRSYKIDDKSTVRSAAHSDTSTHNSNVEYPSILWVPFDEEGFLLAGSRRKAAFDDADLERLRAISFITAMVQQWIKESTESAIKPDSVAEAASFLSHDAKNLLTVIEGRLQLAQEEPEDEHFAVLQQNLERLEELIEDTTFLLQTGDRLDERKPVMLEETAQNAWTNLDTRGANLYLLTDETLLADESRLCQLFENLFRNAVNHAAPDVDIWLGTLEDGSGFYVRDDGPGIEPEQAESLFDLGFSTRPGNTGIGLAIVKRIADAHGWDVTAMNGESGGARFEFRGVEIITG